MIKLNTERLVIYTASRNQMQEIIDSQTDEILKVAYRLITNGCWMFAASV